MLELGLFTWMPMLAVVNLWYSVPLIVCVSLVCAAARHEELPAILKHSLSFGMWIVLFMLGVMGLLALMAALA
jgi:hypothetical protein